MEGILFIRPRGGRSEQLLRTVRDFSDYLSELLETEHGRVDTHTIFRYVLNVQGHATLEALIEAIPSPAVREVAMTIAEQLRQQGMQQGMQQGIQQGIQQGMQQGEIKGRRELLLRQLTAKFGMLDSFVIERIEQADGPTLDRLGEKVITASSLTEVFDD